MNEGDIRLNEIGIGDWVLVACEPAKARRLTIIGRNILRGISGQLYGELCFQGLPITGKMLLHNGFEVLDKKKEVYCALWDKGALYVKICILEKTLEIVGAAGCLNLVEFLYVHQLQRAFRLLGAKRELKL